MKTPIEQLVARFEGGRKSMENLAALAEEQGVSYEDMRAALAAAGCNMAGVAKHFREKNGTGEDAVNADDGVDPKEAGYQETIRKQLAEIRQLREALATAEVKKNDALAQLSAKEAERLEALQQRDELIFRLDDKSAEIDTLRQNHDETYRLLADKIAENRDLKQRMEAMLAEREQLAVKIAEPSDEQLKDAIVALFLKAVRG